MKTGRKTLLKRACAYGMGDIGGNGSFYIINLYFTVFLTQVESIPVWWAGAIVLVGKIVDAVTDPLMGAITDRTHSKLGRHRVYFLWGAAPLLLSYCMLFYSFGIPAGATTLKAVYYMVAYVLFSVVYTMIYVPYNAMLPTLSRDYSERTQYTGMRTVFSSIGGVLPYFLSIWLVGNEYSPADSKGDFGRMGLIFAVIFAASILVTFVFVKEPEEAPAPKTPIRLGTLYREYASLFANHSFRVYLLMTLCANCMSNVIVAAYFYYVAYIGAHYSMYSELFFYHGVTEIAGLVLVYLVARRLGKQVPFRFTLPVVLVGLGCTFFLSPATTRPWMLYVLALVIGFGVSSIGFITSNLYSDLTDVDELMYGARREGICSGISTFCRKLVSGVAVFMVSVVLGLFGFVENPVGWSVSDDGLYPQAASVVVGTRIVFAVIPMILAAVALAMTFRYKLDKNAHAVVQRLIAQKRETGRAEINEADRACVEAITGQPLEKLWVAQEYRPAGYFVL